MPSNARGIWGPHLSYALLPVLLILAASGWVWFANRGPLPEVEAVAVTVRKPVDGMVAAAKLPIEVRFGVPTERTLHLWSPAVR